MQLCIVDHVREARLSLDVTPKDEYMVLGDPRRHYGLRGARISPWTNKYGSNIFPLEESSSLNCGQVRRDQGDRHGDLQQRENQNGVLLITNQTHRSRKVSVVLTKQFSLKMPTTSLLPGSISRPPSSAAKVSAVAQSSI